MNDEKYLFISDSREKKNVARSARNKRTHCGKGGRVKLPSDYLSKRELNAMSGECKSYRLNEPMSWDEFKSMPDDIKITYIKLIREKFKCSDSALAEMFGISGWSVCQEMKRLGLAVGKGAKGGRWDRNGFITWVNRIPTEIVETAEETQEEVIEASYLPMRWDEFRAMPDDKKIAYIKWIRDKFNPSDSRIAKMMGLHVRSFSTEINRLGLGMGQNKRGGGTQWDEAGFYAWSGVPAVEVPVEETQVVEEIVKIVSKPIMPIEENPLVKPLVEIPVEESKPCIPKTGSMVFDGRIEDILKTIGMVLKGADVHLSVHWEVVDNG